MVLKVALGVSQHFLNEHESVLKKTNKYVQFFKVDIKQNKVSTVRASWEDFLC